ncbi:MAG: hypothetical protein AB7K09_21690 [Planctomycetota bacterium]
MSSCPRIRHTAAMLVALALVVLAPGLTTAAWAAPAVGDDAPAMGDIRWLMNAPEIDSVELLRGQVVLIERSSVGTYAFSSLAPEMARLHKKYASKGLHIFSIASDKKETFMRASMTFVSDATFPVGIGAMSNYPPKAQDQAIVWLIGADGKIAFEAVGQNGQGRGAAQYSYDGLEPAIEKALKDVAYPGVGAGIGRADVARSLSSAARAFSKQQYGKAHDAAKKLVDAGKADADDLAQAKELIDWIAKLHEYMVGKARAAEAAGEYVEAIAIWKRIEAQFDGDAADQAKARLKELKDDEAAQKEIKARQQLDPMISGISGSTNLGTLSTQLKAFAQRYDGTAAAKAATALAADADSAASGSK